MKKIVLIALLVAAGCSKKGSSAGGDCEAAMAKGTDSLLATVKTRSGSPQMIESLTEMVGKMKSTLTQRCNEDKWSAEAIDCFTKLTSQAEMRGCEQKLTEEQRNKLRGEMRQLMGSMRMGPGHPPNLGGSAAPPAPGAPPAGEPPPAAPPATGGTAAPADPAAPPAAPATPPAAGSGSSASGW